MLPLLGIVAKLFPDIIKQLGAPLHEQSGSVQDQVLEAIKKATGLQNPETADPQTVKAEMQKPAANAQLEKDLQDIALEDLKERDRAKEEAQRVEFERYRMDAEERERDRAEEFSDNCSTSRIGRWRVRHRCSSRKSTVPSHGSRRSSPSSSSE